MTTRRISPNSFTTCVALLALLVTVLLGGCGGGSEDSGATGDVAGDTGGGPGDTDGPRDDTVGPGDDTSTRQDAGEAPYVIVFPIEAPVFVPVETSKKIPVIVLDPAPVDGAGLVFRLEPVAGDGDATLGANQVLTGSQGTADVLFNANSVAPAEYDLVAVGVGSGGVEARLRIIVDAAPLGELRVTLDYQGTQPLREIRVGVVPARELNCARFYAPAPPDSGTVLASLNDARTFELPANTRYTVWVTARAPSATGALRLAAHGCLDGAYVQSNTTEPVLVEVRDLLLNPAGLYDMVAVFDFTDAIPDTEIGELLGLLIEAFNDPGAFVLHLVDYAVDLYLGDAVGQIVQWALDLFRDQLEDAINDWIENSAPDWLDPVFTVGQDLTQVIARLELLAELRISKIEGDWYVQGDEDWIGLVLYWRLGCAPEGDPAWDPECGRTVLSLDDLQNTAVPVDIIQGVWRGTVTNVDVLQIQTHPIQLNYGRVILFVINELLLPAVSDGRYHSLLEAAQGVVDCASIADNVVGDFLDALGIDRDDVEDYCEGAVTAIVLPIEASLYDLGADSRLRLQGTARLVDEDDDLTVDRIVEGLWDGQIEWDPGNGWGNGDFSGTWEAARQ